MEEFKPFKITIEIKSIEELSTIWLLANSDAATNAFINNHVHRVGYQLPEVQSNVFGRYWRVLQKEIVKYNQKIGNYISG